MDSKRRTSFTSEDDLHLAPIILAIFIVVATIVAFIFYQKRRFARRNVLLLGICDSGKTLIFSRLLHSKFVNTQTSIKENLGCYLINNQTLQIVDIPGHERVRSKFFDVHKDGAKGLVFVIDSVTLSKEIRDVADWLYTILSDPTIYSLAPQVLIICNKQDQPGAKSVAEITELLESELNTVRKTKTSQLQSVDPSAKKTIYLGREDSDFSFTNLKPFKVAFGKSSAHNKGNQDDCDIEDLKIWINKLT